MAFAFRHGAFIIACILLAACSASNIPAVQTADRGAQSAALVTPANGASGLPANGASGMPAGDNLSCNLLDTPGQVDCTIAINLNVQPNGNPNTPAGLLPGYHPSDLQGAYNLPSQATGGTVAIVDAYDDPLAETDLAIYRLTFGLPACSSSSGCFQRVNEYGQTRNYPQPNLEWQEEVSLDMDLVSAICPNCNILLVEANTPSIQDLGTSVDTAVQMGAKIVSNSYYAKEYRGELKADQYYHHPGAAIVVSAGDQPASYYPASSPYVTSVGGTTLSLQNGRSEQAWAPAGHGCSVYEPAPKWQGSTGCATRSVVDVSAVADPQTGVAFWDTTGGGWLVAGGTSVGAPLVAAAYALSANPRGPAYSYAHASGFNEIPPGQRYTIQTGLGSPNGVGGL